MRHNEKTTLYVDVTHTWASDLQTGMQKVVRQLVSAWSAENFNFKLVVYQDGRYVILQDSAFFEISKTYSVRNFQQLDRKIIWNKLKPFVYRIMIKIPTTQRLSLLNSKFLSPIRKYLNTIPRDGSLEVLEVHGIKLLIIELVFDAQHVNFVINLAKNKDVSITFFSYDLIPINYPQFSSSDFIEVFRKYMDISNYSQKLWSISTSTKNELEAHVGDSRYLEQSTFKWLPPSRYLKCEHDLPFQNSGDLGYFLFVSSYEVRKNHLGFLDALQILKANGLEIPKVVFVGGNAWDDGPITKKISQLQMDGFDLLKLLNIKECCVGNLYQQARLTVYPSHIEGFGLPVVESLSFGVPVLTTDFGSTGELLQLPGTLGFNAGDSIDMAMQLAYFLANSDAEIQVREDAKKAKNNLGTWSEYAHDLYAFITKQ